VWVYALVPDDRITRAATLAVFIRKWRRKCPAVAASLEEAGDKLFIFTRFPRSLDEQLRQENS
jgi:transposase-like protein